MGGVDEDVAVTIARRSVLLSLSLLSACASRTAPAPTPAPEPTPIAAPEPAPAASEPALPPGFPDSPEGRQLAWVLATIRGGGKVEAADIEAHFHPSFLAQVPPAAAQAVFGQLAAQLGAFTVEGVVERGAALIARIAAGDVKLRAVLSVEPASGQIAGLLFAPDVDTSARPTSFGDAEAMLPTLAPRAQMLVASVEGGACKPLRAVAAGDRLAIGSTFKLYVLLGVVEQILAGKLTWDAEVAVRDAWKSLPSGVTQDEADGAKLSVRALAERMIAISDNTATDHLLYTVGRKKVEAAMRAAKHGKPALNVPFLATRELFLFKLDLPDAEVEAYLASKPEKRRATLDGPLAARQPTVAGAESWTAPRRIETLEWFASAEDLCRVMATLATRAKQEKAAPLLEVLAKNPGVPVDAAVFPFVGFKGGSEPGVMNLTWLLRRDDDRWFVVSLGFNAPTGPALDEAKIVGFAGGVLELVGREGR